MESEPTLYIGLLLLVIFTLTIEIGFFVYLLLYVKADLPLWLLFLTWTFLSIILKLI